MCNPSWQSKLQEVLASLNKPAETRRVAIVGIGHELRGDDIAGAEIAEMLRNSLQPAGPGPGHDRLLVINAGPAPENCTGPLRRFQPDLVLLIDAAQMDEAPGAIRLLPWRETAGISASTHTLPLHVLAGYIAEEMACEVALLGIQPADTALGAPLSEPVHQAIHEIERELPGMV